ncbi:IS110 family transposase, partial [Rahnella perminowiae]|nr:IS110 family transposase [Rahnella perminowiae]
MTVTNKFAAHVGLDWADKKHDVCVQFKNGERVFHVIEHTAEALDAWLTELLQQLVEQCRQLVEDKRRFVNRIINTLKQYYPQPLEWFSHRGSLLLCELIIRWPSLQQLKRARRDTIRNFLNAKGGRAMALTEQRVVSIDNAIPLTTD